MDSFLFANFLNFLRGMETQDGSFHLVRGWDFLNFLRGMETRCDGSEAQLGLHLPKLP